MERDFSVHGKEGRATRAGNAVQGNLGGDDADRRSNYDRTPAAAGYAGAGEVHIGNQCHGYPFQSDDFPDGGIYGESDAGDKVGVEYCTWEVTRRETRTAPHPRGSGPGRNMLVPWGEQDGGAGETRLREARRGRPRYGGHSADWFPRGKESINHPQALPSGLQHEP